MEEVLDLYFRQCSILVNCADSARIGMFFATKGINGADTPLVSARAVRLVSTFMVTCGMYNGSGEFAIQVGIPAKSGVSGGSWVWFPAASVWPPSVPPWIARATVWWASACSSVCRRFSTSASLGRCYG